MSFEEIKVRKGIGNSGVFVKCLMPMQSLLPWKQAQCTRIMNMLSRHPVLTCICAYTQHPSSQFTHAHIYTRTHTYTHTHMHVYR